MNPIKWKLHWQILLSLALAVLVAQFILPICSTQSSAYVEGFCQFTGRLFMNALKMVIVPLIVASIIAGVMHHVWKHRIPDEVRTALMRSDPAPNTLHALRSHSESFLLS
ncbi:MAG: cation:dicarboxylase symporter family transporter, partial [Verrucomicrobiota bacterium]|nr:cation:dicarboxylase symporter family transporter [Verrucomicrobiota bacterium]